MADLSGDAFVKALQSETITLLAGRTEEAVTISKTLLFLKCEFLANIVDKSGRKQVVPFMQTGAILTDIAVLGLQSESSTAVKLFVCWCYQERLQSLRPSASLADHKEWKNTLIDLWIFAARYNIPKLQNQTMRALIALFNTPHLLTKEDIRYIWARTQNLTGALRGLAALVIVVQVEGSGGRKRIWDFEDLAGLEGLLGRVYTALGKWLTFEMPKLPKEDKRRKWQLFMLADDTRNALMVEETARVVTKPQVDGGRTGDRGFRGFAPGEVIEID